MPNVVKEYIASMKPAVFQINQCDGFVRLMICGDVPTLRSAVELESTLRERLHPRWQVSLLGRFDKIEIATGPADLLNSAVDDAEFGPVAI
jgi:hypothetical protein